MISRKTAIAIGDTIGFKFQTVLLHRPFSGHAFFYDLLFGADLPSWLCNRAGRTTNGMAAKVLIQRLHTGETVREANQADTDEEAQAIGQRLLQVVAEALLNDWRANTAYQRQADPRFVEQMAVLERALEIEGYLFRDGRLLASDEGPLDPRPEAGILETLYASVGLPKRETFLKHLSDSAARYEDGHFGDAIGNARQFLECALREIAATVSRERHGVPLPDKPYTTGIELRKYLKRRGCSATTRSWRSPGCTAS